MHNCLLHSLLQKLRIKFNHWYICVKFASYYIEYIDRYSGSSSNHKSMRGKSKRSLTY